MASKIKAVEIINQKGTRVYCVEHEYNGLILDRIEDKSIEDPTGHLNIFYVGFTKENEKVFEIDNAPVDVQYQRV